MKIIKNTSMQAFSIPFGTPDGVTTIFLGPKKQIEVPDNWNSKVVENLVHRRMMKLVNVLDPQATIHTKQIKKRKTREND